MRINSNTPDNKQLLAFQERRAESMLEEVERAYTQFSRLNNLDKETKLGTVHVPVGCRVSPDGGLSSDQIVNVDLQTYKGYFVAHNSSITLFTGSGYETHPVDDNVYEIISPADSKYQKLKGDAKEKITRAIVDSVEVSTVPPPDGMEQILDELIFPILFDAKVDVIGSIDDLPFNCRFVSKHSISTVVERLLQGAPLQTKLASRLNHHHSALVGSKYLRLFELNAA